MCTGKSEPLKSVLVYLEQVIYILGTLVVLEIEMILESELE